MAGVTAITAGLTPAMHQANGRATHRMGPNLPQAALSVSSHHLDAAQSRLGMDSSCAASQCGLRAVGRPSHIVDLSSAGGAWHSRLVMVGGGRFDKKRMAALSALIGARGDCAASGDIK